MNRNLNSRFAVNPTNIDTRRSTFQRDSKHKTTFNAGDLIPFYRDEVLPGDTFKMGTKTFIRMSTSINPTMDDIFFDLYYFFVPMRLVWEHTKEFFGENTTSKWEQTVDYRIPQITAPTGGWTKGTIADHFGYPKYREYSASALYFRAYGLIWNEWFRDQNSQDPTFINKDDATIIGVNTGVYQTDAQKGGLPLPVCKFHDYFTSCTPEPQKGPDVLLPLGDTAPIKGTNMNLGLLQINNDGQGVPFGAISSNSQGVSGSTTAYGKLTVSGDNPTYTTNLFNDGRGVRITPEASKSGMVADLTLATTSTIRDLREALRLQEFFERDARFGTRYTEIIRSHFGVISPDARQQRPEYLGGRRININISSVVQTSSTNDTSELGSAAGYSVTADKSMDFVKSFTEHGFIIGVCCVRTNHSYQQGLDRALFRQDKFDFYWQEFAHIGDMAVKNKEIYCQGNSEDEETFGYQEAFADYKYKPSYISGAFNSTYNTPLDSWHLADYYDSLPVLSNDFLKETKNNLDRTLAVQSSEEDQFLVDFDFYCQATRCMPMYSIPGFGSRL